MKLPAPSFQFPAKAFAFSVDATGLSMLLLEAGSWKLEADPNSPPCASF
jgi:hypothetical protein